MDGSVRKRVHAFRNALVMASDTLSYQCFHMHRWRELNSFPHGCCDLASNFLAKYLEDNGENPSIIFFQCPEEVNKFIKAHVIVKLGDYYIDITRNQFGDCNSRVVIEDKYGSLSNLIKKTKDIDPSDVKERKIDISDASGPAYDLYNFVKTISDNMLKESISAE